MAQYRTDSLNILKGLIPAAQRIILGIPDTMSDRDLHEIIVLMEGDPWFDPAAGAGKVKPGLEIVSTAGGFRGFGGTFMSPPLVESSEEGIIAFDIRGTWLISADVYGSSLTRMNSDIVESRPSAGEGTITRSGKAEFRGLSAAFPGLADPASFASTGHTMAVTLSTSHSVFLIAARSHGR